MLSNLEIREKCFVNRVRFIQSVQELKRRYPDGKFDELLRESFEEIIKTAENLDRSSVFRSKFYKDHFVGETGIALKKGNPFCMSLLSKSLSINIIFVLLDECKNWGYTPFFIRDARDLTESHIVCPFDLFDSSRNKSLFRIRRQG